MISLSHGMKFTGKSRPDLMMVMYTLRTQQFFNCDDVKGGFNYDRKIGDGISGMNILKQNTREKIGRISRNQNIKYY